MIGGLLDPRRWQPPPYSLLGFDTQPPALPRIQMASADASAVPIATGARQPEVTVPMVTKDTTTVIPDERRIPIPPPAPKVPEVLTKTATPDERLVPPPPPAAPVTTPAPGTTDAEWFQKAKAALTNGDLSGAISQLAKGFGASKGPPVPPAFRVSGFQRVSPPKDISGRAGAMLQGALERLEPSDLRMPIKRRPGERDNYDILKRRRRGRRLMGLLDNYGPLLQGIKKQMPPGTNPGTGLAELYSPKGMPPGTNPFGTPLQPKMDFGYGEPGFPSSKAGMPAIPLDDAPSMKLADRLPSGPPQIPMESSEPPSQVAGADLLRRGGPPSSGMNFGRGDMGFGGDPATALGMIKPPVRPPGLGSGPGTDMADAAPGMITPPVRPPGLGTGLLAEAPLPPTRPPGLGAGPIASAPITPPPIAPIAPAPPIAPAAAAPASIGGGGAAGAAGGGLGGLFSGLAGIAQGIGGGGAPSAA